MYFSVQAAEEVDRRKRGSRKVRKTAIWRVGALFVGLSACFSHFLIGPSYFESSVHFEAHF